MKLTISRNDHVDGCGDIPVSINIEIYDEEQDRQDELNAEVLSGHDVWFELSMKDGWTYDVTAHIDFFEAKSWEGLCAGSSEKKLKFGITKGNYYIIRDKVESKSIQKEPSIAIPSSPTKPHLDPSQIIDESAKSKMQTCFGIAILGVAFIIFGMWNDADALAITGFFGALIFGAAGLYFGSKSGAFHERCPKCNSNNLANIKRTEHLVAVRTEMQERRDALTNNPISVAVNVSDIRIDRKIKCNLCANTWSTSHTETRK